MIDLAKSRLHTRLIIFFLKLRVEKLRHERKNWFMRKLEKILSLEFILSQIFTCIEFSCVNLTDQIFFIGLFHSTYEELGPHPEKKLSLEFPHMTN